MISDDGLIKELRTIKRILLFTNSAAVEKELEKVAPTEERKKIWVLIDGKRMPKDIAKEGKVGERTVNYFLIEASAAGVVDYSKGKPPTRTLDYVPPSWIGLLELAEPSDRAQPSQAQTTIDHEHDKTSQDPQEHKVS